MKILDPETGEEYDLIHDEEVQEDLTAFYKKFHCDHIEKSIVRAINAGGAITYRHQCQRCGALVGNAKSRREIIGIVSDEDITKRNLWDERYHSLREKIFLTHARRQKSRDSAFWIRYNEYLRSPEWQRKRDKVLRRANFICEGCHESKATQVHHITYKNCFEEFLWELVAVCDACHERCHSRHNSKSTESDDLVFE